MRGASKKEGRGKKISKDKYEQERCSIRKDIRKIEGKSTCTGERRLKRKGQWDGRGEGGEVYTKNNNKASKSTNNTS